MRGVAHCLGTNQGLITPGWVPKERVSEDLRPEVPEDFRVFY